MCYSESSLTRTSLLFWEILKIISRSQSIHFRSAQETPKRKIHSENSGAFPNSPVNHEALSFKKPGQTSGQRREPGRGARNAPLLLAPPPALSPETSALALQERSITASRSLESNAPRHCGHSRRVGGVAGRLVNPCAVGGAPGVA